MDEKDGKMLSSKLDLSPFGFQNLIVYLDFLFVPGQGEERMGIIFGMDREVESEFTVCGMKRGTGVAPGPTPETGENSHGKGGVKNGCLNLMLMMGPRAASCLGPSTSPTVANLCGPRLVPRSGSKEGWTTVATPTQPILSPS